jgi:DNA helicase-2/ATP-dependent DNA helicase PcrA
MPIEFTNEQAAVVNHPIPNHGRVLAGPGTGKSATAIGLAERLLAQESPPRLKFLTFTRAATLELDKKLVAHGKARPATVHSFSIATLLRNPGAAAFPMPLRIPDDYEYKQLIRPHLARQSGVRLRKLDDLVREMAAKWESLVPLELEKVSPEERARFVGSFTRHRRIFGYTLLAELPDLLRCALRDHDDLDGIDYDLLIVDEYQDLNACELELLRRLAERRVSIIGIGDDDQSIYSFRKAHPEGIRRFLGEFAGARNYALTICQRLATQIAQWAQYVIGGDAGRLKPPIQCRAGAPDGVAALLNFRSEISEARGVADLVSWLKDTKGVPLSEILILSRTDRAGLFTRPIKAELAARGIPAFDPSEIENHMSEPSNRSLIAMLRLVVDRGDSLAWWTLIDLEPGVGDGFVSAINEAAQAGGVTFAQALEAAAARGFDNAPPASRVRMVQLYQSISTLLETINVPEAAGETKWGNWIVEEANAGRLPPVSDFLRGLFERVDESYEESADGLGRFLSQFQPIAEDMARAQSDGVRFMTMVGSKGLTVRATIVVGVDNDLIPRPDQDIDEERRLLYVAMTRSQEYLFLTWANRRQGPGGRAGHINLGRRTYTELLRGGPVESRGGDEYIRELARQEQQAPPNPAAIPVVSYPLW